MLFSRYQQKEINYHVRTAKTKSEDTLLCILITLLRRPSTVAFAYVNSEKCHMLYVRLGSYIVLPDTSQTKFKFVDRVVRTFDLQK